MIVGCLPPLGVLVERQRLLVALAAERPEMLLLDAPSGYGKTSLALQYATSGRFDVVIWFDGAGREYSRRSLLQSLLWQVRQGCSDADEDLTEASGASLEHRLASLLYAAYWRHSTCLVLDNVVLSSSATDVAPLGSVLRSSIGADSCVIVTSRHPLAAPLAMRSLSLDGDDLRFGLDEGLALARNYGLSEPLLNEVGNIQCVARPWNTGGPRLGGAHEIAGGIVHLNASKLGVE